MHTKDWITLLTSIAAFISALLFLFTIIEMRNQRKSSYKPDIIIKGEGFIINWNEKKYPDLWNNRVNIFVELFNIGMGAAKYLKLTWEFNIENLSKEINKYSNKCYIEYKSIEEILSIKIEDFHKGLIFLKNDLCRYIDYLIPVNIHQECMKICLPRSYIELTGLLTYLFFKKPEIFKDFNLPELKTTIIYYDIGNNEHKKIFNLKLSPNIINEYQNGVSEFAKGIIEVKEVKKNIGDKS
jgi:hypothetical protein